MEQNNIDLSPDLFQIVWCICEGKVTVQGERDQPVETRGYGIKTTIEAEDLIYQCVHNLKPADRRVYPTSYYITPIPARFKAPMQGLVGEHGAQIKAHDDYVSSLVSFVIRGVNPKIDVNYSVPASHRA